MSKKKIKVLKKKKVKEVKNKTEIKQIKKKVEIKEIKKKIFGLRINLENSEIELNGEKFSEILQQNKNPVLEQIAISEGSSLGDIIPIRKKDSPESIDTGSDYTQFGILKEEKNKYETQSPNYTAVTEKNDLDKDEKERRVGETNFEFEIRNKKKGIGNYVWIKQ